MEQNFKRLEIWKSSMAFAKLIHKVTKKFPIDERFALTDQMRRCCVSIASNIAEGTSKKTSKHFVHFLTISIGSIFELQTQLILAHDFGYIDDDNFTILEKELSSIKNRVFAFRNKISK